VSHDHARQFAQLDGEEELSSSPHASESPDHSRGSEAADMKAEAASAEDQHGN